MLQHVCALITKCRYIFNGHVGWYENLYAIGFNYDPPLNNFVVIFGTHELPQLPFNLANELEYVGRQQILRICYIILDGISSSAWLLMWVPYSRRARFYFFSLKYICIHSELFGVVLYSSHFTDHVQCINIMLDVVFNMCVCLSFDGCRLVILGDIWRVLMTE